MQLDRSVVSIQPKATRLIRAPLLGVPGSSFEDEPDNREAATSHFVEPYHADPDQRSVIGQVLEDLDISDDEGRRIFLLALEYEIGAFQQVVLTQLAPIEHATTGDGRMKDIADAARRLLDLLEGASEKTRNHILEGMAHADIFNRIADTRYLASLQCEIDRLACACETGIQAQQRQEGPANEASRRFIKMLANIYTECFESKPSAEPDEPFAVILQTIVEQTGLPVRVDDDLIKQTLSGAALAG